MSSKFITLTTDFGTQDPYVAIMKGVIYQINPHARPVDIVHSIPPGQIVQGAFVLKESYGFFPEGTIHVAVVDPGVGTERKAIAIKTRRFIFLGPDNGLLWPSVAQEGEFETYVLDKAEFFLPKVSYTFHGRDVFAPVAAHLTNGLPLEDVGTRLCAPPTKLELPKPQREKEQVKGSVIWVDRFGNLITNIRAEEILDLPKGAIPVIQVANVRIKGILQTFGDARPGEFLCYIGSLGYLEIGINLGSAKEVIEASGHKVLNAEVTLSPLHLT